MANIFDQFDNPQPPPTSASAATTPAAAAATVPGGGNVFDQFDNPGGNAAPAQPNKPFDVLPLSQDAQGHIHFDPNAGVLGSVIRAVEAPGDAYEGKFDPFSQEGMRRAWETASLITPVNPAVRAGDLALPGVEKALTKPETTAPTAEALRNAATAGYTAVRNTGATYPGEAVGAAAQSAIKGLNDDGFLPILAPQTHNVLGQLANPPKGSTITIASLDAVRKAFNRIAGNFQNPTEQAAAQRAIETIDQIIEKGGSAPSVAGAASSTLPSTTSAAEDAARAQAAALLPEARGNYAAASRSDRLNGLEETAELRAAAANSGHNLGNTIRQRVVSLVSNPKQARGFSPDELEAAKGVARGTVGANLLRHTGNMLGGGGGVGHALVGGLGAIGGAALGGTEGAAAGAATLPLIGSAARAAYNSSVVRQLEALDDLVRMRSPLYQKMVRETPAVAANPVAKAAAARAALLGAPGSPGVPLSSLPTLNQGNGQ